MANDYTTFTAALVTALQGGLVGAYPTIETRRGIWAPRNLAPFTRYLVFVAPPLQDPVRHVRVESPRQVTPILKADVFLLVKNYDEDKSVWGGTSPDFGIWQLLDDTQDVLRNTNLGGLIERTYREADGGSAFETGAAGGFETGGHGWVHRVRLTYTAQLFAFCHPA